VTQPPVVKPPFTFLHADTLSGAKVRVSGAGGRYPSVRCGRCVLSRWRQPSTISSASCSVEKSSPLSQSTQDMIVR
jgi:hypothetical protein